jgi:hypothetical protein
MPASQAAPPFDFRKPVAYDDDAKHRFHVEARRQLRLVAVELGLKPGAYDLRSNEGGIAVSGEITLHADHLYVQAAQSFLGGAAGLMFRACNGRQDYCGDRNHYASLDLLHDPRALARKIREALHV